jgi:hypothetical protein
MTQANTIKITDEVNVPKTVNQGISVASPQFMETLLGCPRKSYTSKCQAMTNKELYDKHITMENVGPFRVTGLRHAVESLRVVLADVSKEQPVVYEVLGCAGMLCCRYMGSKSKVSNHSWGIAIDLLIDGKLDPYNNGKTFYGLTLIAPIFNRHGWFWGARYRTSEDAMHFEVCKEKLLEWARAGLLGTNAEKVAHGIKVLRPGAKGPQVRKVQEALKKHVPSTPTHGHYDHMTERAVKVAQLLFSMTPTGIMCKELLRRLKVVYEMY